MLHKHDGPLIRLVVTLVYLAVFAQLGVLTRTFLSTLFTLGCGGGWGPCIDGARRHPPPAAYRLQQTDLIACSRQIS